ncbi:PREDICTED: pentatricopeptide repeat-containing protein At5g66520-like [Tarenaya hassleriana]|uniref:pentatricopeptide repeat-containing protein At5g66520-like n=1 Tax=Tarenaya hassleriana TaxID=28532 RepID=UPI00053C9E9F|nr:PREDICTED: pentatricopeptide repeat-containing protein At5g66520-like [Tarenaya hassleriana]
MSTRAIGSHLPKATEPFRCKARAISSHAAAIRDEPCPYKSLETFVSIHRLAIPLESFSLVYALQSAASLRNLSQIRHIHCLSIKLGFSKNVYAATSLLNGYVTVSMSDACKLFDELSERNTATWNTMITGHLRSGNVRRASEMFKTMPYRNAVSWSTFISDHVNNGRWVTGLGILRDMMFRTTLKPDQKALSSVILGCSRLDPVGLLLGRSVHGFMVKHVRKISVNAGSALIDMYARFGFMKYAIKFFDFMQEKNVVTWTALICGSALHSDARKTLALFEEMQVSGVRPNELTFTGVLKACVNSGLVHEGRKYFKMMEEYGLEPKIHHLGCMVDLLGNAGLIEEAYEVIQSMKLEPNIVIWGSFLSACREHNKLEMAEGVIELVLRNMSPETVGSGVYSLMYDIYAMNQKWDAAEKVREFMNESCARKIRGSSFIST